MRLLLDLAMQRLNVDTAYFFRLAHIWKFGRSVDVTLDVRQHEFFGITPQYVVDYLEHIKATDGLPLPPTFPGYQVFQQ